VVYYVVARLGNEDMVDWN